jgi:hypothetical protein
MKRGPIFQCKILFKIQRRNFPQTRNKRLALPYSIQIQVQIGFLLVVFGMVFDVFETRVGVGDGGQVGEEIGSGEIGLWVFGDYGSEIWRSNGPPADPGGGIGGGFEGVRVVEDGREVLDGIGIVGLPS